MEETVEVTPLKTERTLSRHFRVTAWILLTGLVVYGAVALWFDWHPIQYHRFGLIMQVHQPAKVFSGKYLLWNLQGRRSTSEILAVREHHVKMLIELGYLVDERFYLQNVRWDEETQRSFYELKNRWWYDGRLKDETAWMVFPPRSELLVFATPEMLPVWREMVREFDAGELSR